ncbi:hypothetical protein [Neomoorella humiferrea]|uniref:hypothetical protein n=1 Tax=Neomoorella humiferrea TaxID=676965 RepID=UPI0030CFFE27
MEWEISEVKKHGRASKKKTTLKVSREEPPEESAAKYTGYKVSQLTILDEQENKDDFFI